MSTSAALAERKDEDRAAPFQEMDRLDEEQILEELKGHIIEQFFYEFTDKGQRRVGLSFSGVKWMAEQLVSQGRLLSIIHTDIRESADGKSYFADATCQELNSQMKRNGHAQQAKFYQGGGENPFAYTLAGSKAERNAMRHFIPETAIQEGYKEWMSKKGAAGARRVEPPPAKDVTNDSTVRDVPASSGRSLEEVQFAFKDYPQVMVVEEEKRFVVTYPPNVAKNTFDSMREIAQKMGGRFLLNDEGGPALAVPKA